MVTIFRLNFNLENYAIYRNGIHADQKLCINSGNASNT